MLVSEGGQFLLSLDTSRSHRVRSVESAQASRRRDDRTVERDRLIDS